MKYILTFVSTLILTVGASAQSNKVVSAFNYLKYYKADKKAEDILNARKYIDEASVHEKTMADEKMWNYRAQIYMEIVRSKDPAVTQAVPNPLDEAYRSFEKSSQLEGRGGYQRIDPEQGMKMIGAMYMNAGIDAFSAKEFDKALEYFEKSAELNKKNNVVDSLAYYNAALAAERSNNYDKAAQYYNECLQVNYGGAKIYQYLTQVYIKQEETDKAFQIVQAGRKAFPEDKNLIIDELNFYLKEGKNKEAVDNLKLAIAADPQNHILHYSLGVVYDNLSNSEGVTPAQVTEYNTLSENAYKKSLEIKPDFFDALYNLGAMHFNRGVKMIENANTITDNVKYSKEVKKADTEFNLAIPYLEKAMELQPDDVNTLSSLKQLYARMGMDEKYKQVNDKLKN